MESIIDTEVIESYEKETGKQWTETEEHMAEICSFFDYGFAWNEKGNIVINNGYYEGCHQDYYKFLGKNIEIDVTDDNDFGLDWDLRHYEYENAKNMVEDWIPLCKESNEDYVKNGSEAPFKWCL